MAVAAVAVAGKGRERSRNNPYDLLRSSGLFVVKDRGTESRCFFVGSVPFDSVNARGCGRVW